MELILKVEKPTAQAYFEKYFQNSELDWADTNIYTLPIYIPFFILVQKLTFSKPNCRLLSKMH